MPLRPTAAWKTRDDLFDSITPKTDLQGNVSAPYGPHLVAAWLPVQWQGNVSKDYFVLSGSKLVAYDAEGRIVPAGYRKRIENATAVTDVMLTYTSTDVAAGVIDIRTGQPLVTADIGDVTIADLANAILSRGLVIENEVEADFAVAGTFDDTEIGDCQLVCLEWISEPVGIAAYDFYAWPGGADQNDFANLNFTNYSKQVLVQYLTDQQVKLPVLVAGSQTTAALNTFTAWAANAATGLVFPSAKSAPAELWLTRAQLVTLDRYASMLVGVTDVVGLQVENYPVARNTDRTPITSSSTLLSRERSSVSAIRQAGDWWLDAEVGIIFVYESGGNALPAGTDTISYHYYVGGNAAAEKLAHFVGRAKPGDYVGYDEESNFVSLGRSPTDRSVSIGRVSKVIQEPAALMPNVRTAWEGASFTKEAQMPGSATKGFSDLITLSDETVADTIVYVNLKIQ